MTIDQATAQPYEVIIDGRTYHIHMVKFGCIGELTRNIKSEQLRLLSEVMDVNDPLRFQLMKDVLTTQPTHADIMARLATEEGIRIFLKHSLVEKVTEDEMDMLVNNIEKILETINLMGTSVQKKKK